MRMPLLSLACAALLASAVPAVAQETLTPPAADDAPNAAVADSSTGVQSVYRGAPPRGRPSTIGVAVYGIIDYQFLLATQSYEAVLGSSKLPFYGAGADITGVWKGLLLRVDGTHASKSGSRVVVDASNRVIPVNIPITITWTPIEFGAGWRFVRKRSRAVPYIGAGGVVMSYSETSQFAEPGDNVATRFTGYTAFAGVDVPVYRHVQVGFEANFRSFPNSLGDSANSVSQSFGEKDAGGYGARLTVGYSWHKR